MIEKMNLHYSFTNPASVHEEEALTALELAGRQGAKINEVIEAQNNLSKTTGERLSKQDSDIENIRSKTVPEAVKAECVRLMKSGEFDEAINLYLNNLEERVDNLLSHVPEGGTTSDAELMDIRTRATGVTYSNAGGSIRAIDSDLQNTKALTHGNMIHHEFMQDCTNWTSENWNPEMVVECSQDNKMVVTVPASIGSTNPGICTKQFTVKNGLLYILIDFECNRNEGLNLYLANSRGFVSGQQTDYHVINPGRHLLKIDPETLPHDVHCVWLIHPSAQSTENTYIYTINEFKVFQNPLIDMGMVGDNARDFLAYLHSKNMLFEYGVNVQLGLKNLFYADNYDTVRALWDGRNAAEYTHPETNAITWDFEGDSGIMIPIDPDSDKRIRIEFDLEYTTNDSAYFLNLFVADSHDTQGHFMEIETFRNPGHYSVEIDPAYHSVYSGFDISCIWFVSHCKMGDGYFHWTTIRNILIHQSALLDAGYSGNIALDIIKAGNKTGAMNNDLHYLVNPNGEKYITQMGVNGLTAIPVVPGKSLFIGNSLLGGFGFGMAASDSRHDYYHLFNDAVKTMKASYVPSKYQGAEWEGLTTIAAQNAWCENTLSPYLSSGLDLVVVQLGDNVNTPEKQAVFAEGSRNLLKYIRTRCPNARVVWMGAWYQSETKMNEMIAACKATGSTFVNIWDLHTPENESKVGNTYTKDDGTVMEITSAGVASHPGDSGMKAIANRLLYTLGISEVENFYV